MLQYFLPRIPKNRGPVNRPREFFWLQQKLSNYRFLYNFRSVLPFAFLVALLCFALSAFLFIISIQAGQELVLEYTYCTIYDTHFCDVDFTLKEDMEGDIEVHYGLDSFFQNSRGYLRSRDDSQLSGQVSSIGHCQQNSPNYFHEHDGQPVVPCGVVAGSFFNDTFQLFHNSNPVPLSAKDINVEKLRKKKYRNPKICKSTPCPGFEHTIQPPTWKYPIQNLGDCETGLALQNLDLIVWMETAALPTFRKIYRKVDKSHKLFERGLPKGKYVLRINNNFPVHAYKGRKKVILTRKMALGRGNMYHCIAYLVLGSVLLQFSLVVFCLKYLFKTQTNYCITRAQTYTT